MFITIALIVIVLATFLLIMVNMFSDYSARREQDMRLLVTHAHNVVAETEELLEDHLQLQLLRDNIQKHDLNLSLHHLHLQNGVLSLL